MTFDSYSQKDTEDFAAELAKKAVAGDFFALVGGLGAGKTAFARGFARGLGVVAHITSPTFAIINEYSGNLPLYHFDVYRINNADDMYDTGFEEYFYASGVCLVEWADMITEILPPNAKIVRFEQDLAKGEQYRKITIGGQNFDTISN
ncbi:MAG: tRNA (adenosine(37)-N6)-threonylcarbamoyltransferase complex ATPase subunit type 1 TsaE [Defluviitaleaceae bacterium]|nr:tRNA (adenosine(37)-N6)-threonylcarbamoyltransferase complex ATPase subunit type 1 TsaE [Defluviitaleaceae bacterium]